MAQNSESFNHSIELHSSFNTCSGKLLTLLAASVLVWGCHSAPKREENVKAVAEKPVTQGTVAMFGSSSNPKIKGDLAFSQTSTGVRLSGKIVGLKPRGVHGLHIHEIGDCSAPDFSTAGAHLNPEGAAHGAPGLHTSHAGDLGNVKADKKGVVSIDMEIPTLSISTPPNNVVGRSLVLHARSDDLRSQPAGESGPRIGCGVITPL